jgi:uncharacterized secreted protein with C-terminal beta-propeller domain
MITVIATALSPVLEVAILIAFLAMIAAPIYYFSTKTQIGERIMTLIGMNSVPQHEEYKHSEFRIHRSNYIHV